MGDKIKMPAAHPDSKVKCGQCRWFYIGYKNNNCQVSRQVILESQACIEFEPHVPSAFDKVYRDKFILDLQRNVSTFTEQYMEDVEKEIKTFKLSTSTKPVHYDYADPNELIELSNKFDQCQAYTDRIVEIIDVLWKKSAALTSMAKEAQAYIHKTYAEHIRNLKNESERSSYFYGAIPFLFKAIDDIENLKARAEAIKANLKDTHFSLSERQVSAKAVWDYRIMTQTTTTRKRQMNGDG